MFRWIFIVTFLVCASQCIFAETQTCNINGKERVLNKIDYKGKITHVWQGAVDGIQTNNSDRINGVYDLDFVYLIWVDETTANNADYIIAHLSTRMSFGSGIDEKVGGYFSVNESAKGDNDFYADKAFAEFTIMGRDMVFYVGKIQIEDYFDSNVVANCEYSQFLAGPLYINQSIPLPGKGFGAVAKWQQSDNWYIQAGIGDAHANQREIGWQTGFHGEDDFISMAEVGFRPDLIDKTGNYRFTLWYDPQKKEYLDSSGIKRDDAGFSMSFDQQFTDKMTAFFRYGWADDKVNETEDFISFGAQLTSPLKGRDDDVFAIGYAQGKRSTHGLAQDQAKTPELIEAYYNIQLTESLNLTPSLQFVSNPGGQKKQSNATVFGLRCVYEF